MVFAPYAGARYTVAALYQERGITRSVIVGHGDTAKHAVALARLVRRVPFHKPHVIDHGMADT